LLRSEEEVLTALSEAVADDVPLVVRKREDRYVLTQAAGSSPKEYAEFPGSLTKQFDEETETRAVWAATFWAERRSPYIRKAFWAAQKAGHMQLGLQRVRPRHGFVSTYRNHQCRCLDCDWANTVSRREYLDSRSSDRVYVHGPGCYKRGCKCEEYHKAARERMRKSRAKRAAEKAKSLGAGAGAKSVTPNS
jgi:hypothetical protein